MAQIVEAKARQSCGLGEPSPCGADGLLRLAEIDSAALAGWENELLRQSAAVFELGPETSAQINLRPPIEDLRVQLFGN